MAKKKAKKKQQSQQFLSPEKFLRERMRTVEIGKCYVSDGIWEQGMGHVMVTRKHTGGKVSFGNFLIDTYCLGVKNCMYRLRMDDYEFDDLIDDMTENLGLHEVEYVEAHNIIYGALEFAEEGGIDPHKDFALAKYFLEEDTEDIPLIEYDFGYEGKHFLMANDNLELTTYLPTLRKNLPEDQVKYMVKVDYPEDDVNDDFGDEYDDEYNDEGFYSYDGSYSYHNHSYPEELHVKHPEVLRIIQKKGNEYAMSQEELDEILSLPCDELRQDLENIIFYYLGCVNDGDGNLMVDVSEDVYSNTICHAAMLLREVGNCTTSLDAILEIKRQSTEIIDFLIGDFGNHAIIPSLIVLGKDNLPMLEKFLYEETIQTNAKVDVFEALVSIAYHYPEKRPLVIDIFKKFGERALEAGEDASFTNYDVNGMYVWCLVDLKAKELLPLIEQLYKEDLLAEKVPGDWASVKADILSDENKYKPYRISLREDYESLAKFYRRD